MYYIFNNKEINIKKKYLDKIENIENFLAKDLTNIREKLIYQVRRR